MKKVIDVNFLPEPKLTDYLRADKRNLVVFQAYACMEMYKGSNISKSIEIVSKFPKQVIVLKSTQEIIKLSLSPDGLNKFEDPIQTEGFREFCLDVDRAVKGDLALESQILQKGKLASEHFNKLLPNTEFIRKGIEKLAPDVVKRIKDGSLLLAAFLFRDHPDVDEMPQASQLPNSYILRYAVSAYLLELWWISNGGPGNVKLEKLQNDCVDMHYVAHATFYDGLLTRDAKMEEIYKETCFVLENAFSAKINRNSSYS